MNIRKLTDLAETFIESFLKRIVRIDKVSIRFGILLFMKLVTAGSSTKKTFQSNRKLNFQIKQIKLSRNHTPTLVIVSALKANSQMS